VEVAGAGGLAKFETPCRPPARFNRFRASRRAPPTWPRTLWPSAAGSTIQAARNAAIGLASQVSPAVGHLHRAGQQQAGGHRPAEQEAVVRSREFVPPARHSGLGDGGGSCHQRNPAPRPRARTKLNRHRPNPHFRSMYRCGSGARESAPWL